MTLTSFKMVLFVLLILLQVLCLNAAILPPPWADPNKNPCAAQPGGWLFLFWPSDGKCYRIFQRGYPCPATMELSPMYGANDEMSAECRCPPGLAQNGTLEHCHQIYTKGPCQRGQYFAPELRVPSRQRRGRCLKAGRCATSEEVFWPPLGKCFQQYTKGPCPGGQLLTLNKETQLAECQCSSSGPLAKFFWGPTKSCYQHFTKGPCLEKGTLFLPGSQCGCHEKLPNYHPETKMCYEIGGLGPCKPGHRYELDLLTMRGTCVCKPDYDAWSDGRCYRRYTRGPCAQGEIFINSTSCLPIPCPKGKLYFPEDDSCYRVGVEGPCPRGQLVLFEQSIRPSVEGFSYRGMCGCSGPDACQAKEASKPDNDLQGSTTVEGRTAQNDLEEGKKDEIIVCEEEKSQEEENCHLLYTQGPCTQGQWLVPARQGRGGRQLSGGHRFLHGTTPILFQDTVRNKLLGRCECRPGYSKTSNGCRLPLVDLAKFLNGQDYFR